MAEGRALVEQYVAAFAVGDWDTVASSVSEDFEEEYPQSGERIRGRRNFRAMFDHMPRSEGSPGEFRAGSVRVVGADDRWILTPTFTPLKVEGTGDRYAIVFEVRYPDGSDWHIVSLLAVREGRIARATTFFGPRFEPAPWRAPFVEVDRA